MNSEIRIVAPDQAERERALDAGRSVLVQAPAGSGKTTLLAERFLRLLAEVDEPGQVVAITFTNAAAAEMRNRILDRLRSEEPDALAQRVLQRGDRLGWRLLDLPAQLRIATIDSFCRDLALQQPLLSSLGSGLGVYEQPADLYRRAARRMLSKIDAVGDSPGGRRLSEAIEALLLWRDNHWQEMEDLLVAMLGQRDRWMQDFVLSREPAPTELEAVRARLEQAFVRAVRGVLEKLDGLMDATARAEALKLARFACGQSGGQLYQGLAELAEFPRSPFADDARLEEAREAFVELAALLFTKDGGFRKRVDVTMGFPPDCKAEKARLVALIAKLREVEGFEAALAAVRALPAVRYTEEEWAIVRACFTLLRHAAAELEVVFAEAGAVDFVQVAQIAGRVLKGEDGLPTDAAQAAADGIRHLLVDEFQDTSRRQHQLLTGLMAAWPERTGRTCFVVGDPMQSIYGFREADAELFARVKKCGFEIAEDEALRFDAVGLTANFRSARRLVEQLNAVFEQVFAQQDGSGVEFAPAQAARGGQDADQARVELHFEFVPQTGRGSAKEEAALEREAARERQTAEMVELIRGQMRRVEKARATGAKHRVAVLGRTRSALGPVALALREAGIPFRAVELEKLAERPEVLDALGLARALLNPMDRVAWLGVLRAPWCGLSLAGLHNVTSADDAELVGRAVPALLRERVELLGKPERAAAERVMHAMEEATRLRAEQPAAAVGTWLKEVWLRLGGAACVDATGQANVELLWSCLDRLPAGEQDLLGPALDAALEKLTAQPDPAASSECGVQLMTIHKSKGLEFEVVLVPELQARGRLGDRKMLAWLERGLERGLTRGLSEAEEAGEVTEFLVAPFQAKGAERGSAKAWVDGVIAEREKQEMRRILYVAATRAREELHLFARPAWKRVNGEMSLAEPKTSLLKTAWPGIDAEVRARFDEWKQAQGAGDVLESIAAAAGESNLLTMPTPAKPTLLRRLPAGFGFGQSAAQISGSRERMVGLEESALYARHQGGLVSRALGTAVHELLEELARLRATGDWAAARAGLAGMEPRMAAMIRAAGVEPTKASALAAQAMRQALDASRDALGEWILAPHADAESEASWAGVVGGTVRTVRVDRVFRGGAEPLAEGEDCWWIVDYKTAHAEDAAEALPDLRKMFAPQVEAYGKVLRNLNGSDAVIRAGLYYPRMLRFDWWQM